MDDRHDKWASDLLRRIEKLRADLQLSDRQVGLAGGNAFMMRDMRKRGSVPNANSLSLIAAKLGVSTEFLLHGKEGPTYDAPKREEQNVADVARDFRFTNLPKDVPVLGTVLGCTNGEIGGDVPLETHLMDMGDTIDIVRRPAGLSSARDAYALYVAGDSQSPRFDPGDLIFVNPRRPAAIGDDVVVQLVGDGDSGVVTALIKRLIRRNPAGITLQQFNPAREISVPAARIAAIHRITPLAELLGV